MGVRGNSDNDKTVIIIGIKKNSNTTITTTKLITIIGFGGKVRFTFKMESKWHGVVHHLEHDDAPKEPSKLKLVKISHGGRSRDLATSP